MRKVSFFILFIVIAYSLSGQTYVPPSFHRHYVSDSMQISKRYPWRAVAEVLGINAVVWSFDRYVVKNDWAYINCRTIKDNFRTGPVWDTDQFTTNLFSHPYHGSLYFNTARSNGMNFWQSTPFVAGGSLIWEFFMENQPPSINDMLATTFGGIELGEITYRLSDLFIDERSSGAERIGREVLAGIISPVRAFNRLLTGDAWKYKPSKGRHYSSVPVNFVVSSGVRFLSEQDEIKHGTTSMNLNFHIDYGNPYEGAHHDPYDFFRFHLGLDFFSSQPVVNQVNGVGMLWGKSVWEKEQLTLTAGLFQHFDFYNSGLHSHSTKLLPPYRIAAPASFGGGLLYKKRSTNDDKTEIYCELYGNGIILGASLSDYMKLGERDYNLGSGYSVKGYASIVYDKKWVFHFNMENYHVFTWKGYQRDIDWSAIDPEKLSIQGDKSNARLTIFSLKLGYMFNERWSILLSNRYFTRRTNYRDYPQVDSSTYDLNLSLAVRI